MDNPCGSLQLDMDGLFKQLRDTLAQVLEEGTETLLDLMQDEIQKTTHGDAPGKPVWRDHLAAELQEVYRVVADEVIEFGVGLPYMNYADAGYKFVRAMLVAYGSGSEAGGKAIRSRPGEMVWDEDLREVQPSRALTEYNLPGAFNQTGNDFITNAMKLMQTHFRAQLEGASAKLPKGLFSSHVRTVPR